MLTSGLESKRETLEQRFGCGGSWLGLALYLLDGVGESGLLNAYGSHPPWTVLIDWVMFGYGWVKVSIHDMTTNGTILSLLKKNYEFRREKNVCLCVKDTMRYHVILYKIIIITTRCYRDLKVLTDLLIVKYFSEIRFETT